MRDSQQVKTTGERITSCMMQHLNERVPFDVIASESGLSIQDIQEFFALREIIDDFKTDISFYEDKGTSYCMLQDNRHAMARISETSDATRAANEFRDNLDKIQAKKLDLEMATMQKVDTIFSTITAAVFFIVLPLNVYLLINNTILKASTFNPTLLPSFITSFAQILVQILAFIIMWRIDARSNRVMLKKGMKTCYGVDVMIAGIIGCFAWGIGAFYIIKAMIILAGEASKDNAVKRSSIAALLPMTDGLNNTCWILPVFTGTAGIVTASASLLSNFLVDGFLGSIILNQALETIEFSMLGIIVGGLYHARVFHAIKRGEYKKMEASLFFLGIIGLICYGTSVPMLIELILLLIMQDSIHKAKSVYAKQPIVKKPSVASKPMTLVRPEKALETVPASKPALEKNKLFLDFDNEPEYDLKVFGESNIKKPKQETELKLLCQRDE